MDEKLSTDTIAIVASNLVAAHVASGYHHVTSADPTGDILNLYWEYVGELGDAAARERRSRG